MTGALIPLIARELDTVVPPEVSRAAACLAARLDGTAVLYYGSTLRTGDLDGILDFYVLIDGLRGNMLQRLGMRWLWPDVSYHEIQVGSHTIRAKVATMPIAYFEKAALGRKIDSTVWARFVQPAALVYVISPLVVPRVVRAIADAVTTAARFAAVLGPVRGEASDFWLGLFRETYRAELRVEPPGREATILMHNRARYINLLPIAWSQGGIAFEQDGGWLTTRLTFEQTRELAHAWLIRSDFGKVLNVARLIKAAFTFEGAARYGLWKIYRHTGIIIELTPWRERHPILASLPVLLRVLQARTP